MLRCVSGGTAVAPDSTVTATIVSLQCTSNKPRAISSIHECLPRASRCCRWAVYTSSLGGQHPSCCGTPGSPVMQRYTAALHQPLRRLHHLSGSRSCRESSSTARLATRITARSRLRRLHGQVSATQPRSQCLRSAHDTPESMAANRRPLASAFPRRCHQISSLGLKFASQPRLPHVMSCFVPTVAAGCCRQAGTDDCVWS
jgi:hypothetical protein